jgi:predicted Zn-dependent peptidase
MQFHHRTLANGLDVVAETNPRAQSVAVGFFVRTGSRDESSEVSGVSHFLEHMAFKGNDRFTADDVNRVFDEVGAKYNASTSEEVTLFYAAILPEYLPRTFELLAALLRPALREEDFELERNVILEEIGMYEDAPTFQVYDQAMQTHFDGHPLGRRILGTSESISSLRVEQMRAYHCDRYRAGNLLLAVAGNVLFDDVVRLAEEHCGDWSGGDCGRDRAEAHPRGSRSVLHRPTHLQEHVMQFAPAPPTQSPLRYAADLLAVVIGDDSGSRLYWELVDPGHAESCELTYTDFDGSGCWGTYLCTLPDQTAANLRRIAGIYASVNADGVTEDELDQARNKVLTRIVLSSERPMGRLSSLGGNWIARREYRTVAEDLATVKSLTTEDLRELLERYPLGQTTTVGVGPLERLPGM